MLPAAGSVRAVAWARVVELPGLLNARGCLQRGIELLRNAGMTAQAIRLKTNLSASAQPGLRPELCENILVPLSNDPKRNDEI